MSIEPNNNLNNLEVFPPTPPSYLVSINNGDNIINTNETAKEFSLETTTKSEEISEKNIILNQDNKFTKGKFLYTPEYPRVMLVNAWNAITQLELWGYMSQSIDSYMFSNAPEVDRISRKMEELGYNGHSGYSFGWTMRQMQYIAKYGEEKYAEEFNKNK